MTSGADQVTDEVVRLARQRLRPAKIAAHLNIEIESVYNRLSYARRKGLAVPRFTTSDGGPSGGRALIPEQTLEGLKGHAAKRGMEPRELASLIIVTVVDCGLIDAVLDDGEEIDV